MFFSIVYLSYRFIWAGKYCFEKEIFGKYKGTIPAYKIQSDNSILEVGASAIYIDLVEDIIDVKIGNMQMHGTYRILFKAKTYYLLEARMEGQTYSERIKMYIKGKTLEREGLYPQPKTELEKI